MKRVGKKLVIISVPLYRISRVTLSDRILGALRDNYDVLIVAPFANNKKFQKEFGADRVYFLQYNENKHRGLLKALYTISEILRVNGYWYRNRKKGMAFYLKNQFIRLMPDGKDVRIGLFRRLFIKILCIIGSAKFAWQMVDSIIGKKAFLFSGLSSITDEYEQVVLIQSASWGMQDRTMAWHANNKGWKKILIPYTTDQLDMNGYLLTDYDYLLIQGGFEYNRAITHHDFEKSKIKCFGSVWFRHLDDIRENLPVNSSKKEPFILYAGASRTYYPRNSEFEAIDLLIQIIKQQKIGLKLIYRPVEFDELFRREIIERYDDVEQVELQWPQASAIGMHEYQEVNQKESLASYIDDFSGCVLFVMSLNTSLVLDVAYLEKCGVIANFYDPTGMLKNRNTELFHMGCMKGGRITYSLEGLRESVEYLLENREVGEGEAKRIIKEWDYPETNMEQCLLDSIID